MKQIKAFMLSQHQTHGARTMEAREVKSSATIGKLNALLKKTSESTAKAPEVQDPNKVKVPEVQDSSKTKVPEVQDSNKTKAPEVQDSGSKSADKKSTKGYGTHNGSTHVQKILETKVDQNSDEIAAILESSLNALGSRASLEIRALKYKYKTERNNLEEQYRLKYGNRLTESQYASLQNAKAKLSFSYYATQIIVVMMDPDEQFTGSEWDKDRNAYVLVTKSRTVYTSDLLNGVAKEIASIVAEKRVSRLVIEKSYDTNQVIAVYNEDSRSFQRLRMDDSTKKILGLVS